MYSWCVCVCAKCNFHTVLVWFFFLIHVSLTLFLSCCSFVPSSPNQAQPIRMPLLCESICVAKIHCNYIYFWVGRRRNRKEVGHSRLWPGKIVEIRYRMAKKRSGVHFEIKKARNRNRIQSNRMPSNRKILKSLAKWWFCYKQKQIIITGCDRL